MTALPVEQPYRTILIALLLVWALLLVLGFAFGRLNEEGTNRIPLLNRMASSAILVICALIWWQAGARGGLLGGAAALIAFGMAFGLLGDLIMARLIPTPNRVIFGILAFGVGHVLYAAAYLTLAARLGASDPVAQAVSVVIMMVVAVGVWQTSVRSPSAGTVLNIGSLGYALLMAVMVGLAVALAVKEPRLIPLAVGAALFMTSDIILGNEIFRENTWRLVGDVVWMTYISGQVLIVFSMAAALAILEP